MNTVLHKRRMSEIDNDEVDDCIKSVFSTLGLPQHPLNDNTRLTTLGDLYQEIEKSLTYKQSPQYLGQQAFYQLRDAVAEVLKIDRNSITPSTRLDNLFPGKGRWKKIRQVESLMGIRNRIAEMNKTLRICFVVLFFGAICLFFYNWMFALSGVGLTIALFRIASVFNTKFTYPNLHEVAEYLMIFEYTSIKGKQETLSMREAKQVVNQILIRKFDVEEKQLTPEFVLFRKPIS